MPTQLLLSHVPVDLSVIQYDLDAGENIFLSYTHERWQGPPIQRTGKGPPYMILIGGRPLEITTNAFGLRLGTWLIQDRLREDELKEARSALEDTRGKGATLEDLEVLNGTIRELSPTAKPPIRAHDRVFEAVYPNQEIIGQQGCGDLTMNSWNVAYVNSPLAHAPHALVCLPQEPLERRTYTCLVKWKPSESRISRMTIEEVQFCRESNVREPNEMVCVRFRNEWLPRGDQIEFAVSNQQVIRDGQLVPVTTTCEQFGDLRHLLQMPTLNPDGTLFPGEIPETSHSYRPRQYFSKKQFGDIWFGEEAFLSDESYNLRRASLAGPIFLHFPSDSNEERLRGALNLAGYREVPGGIAPLTSGQWRFLKRSPEITVVEISFKRNTYAWSMIGLSADNRRIFSLACTGVPGRTGYTLEQAAEILLRAGACNALLIDEGADVFQMLKGEDGNCVDVVPRLRRRLRATFILARERTKDR